MAFALLGYRIPVIAILIFLTHLSKTEEVDEHDRVSRSDLIIVMASTSSRKAIVQATQLSRRGVRTFIVTESGPQLDPPAGSAQMQLRMRLARRAQVYGAYNGGDIDQQITPLHQMRLALAPFLANVTLGQIKWKWMIFGHDDTMWMIENVLKLLDGLDPRQPQIITDNMWFSPKGLDSEMMHPSLEAPFCLPCRESFSDLQMEEVDGTWRCSADQKEAPLGCPCTRSQLSANVMGRQQMNTSTEDFKSTLQKASFRIHIGAGVIFSRSLMRLESFEKVHSWMTSSLYSSADAMVTNMIWELMKMGVTKPGVDYCRPGMNLFDPGFREGMRADGDVGRDGGNDPRGILHQLSLAQGGDEHCNGECKEHLGRMVSVHVRPRYAREDLSGKLGDVADTAPRFNATVALIGRLTRLSEDLHLKSSSQNKTLS